MKLVIAGSRNIYVPLYAMDAILNGLIEFEDTILEVVSGGCPTGPDKTAKEWVREYEEGNTKYTEFAADWNKHGKSAGPIRNRQMAEYGDSLLLIWDGKSKGSSSMKREMLKQNKPVHEIIIKSTLNTESK